MHSRGQKSGEKNHNMSSYTHTFIHTVSVWNTQSKRRKKISAHTYIHTHSHIHTYTHIHTHKYIHTHTYIHTGIVWNTQSKRRKKISAKPKNTEAE